MNAIAKKTKPTKKPFVEKSSGWNHWTTPADFLERVRRIAPTGIGLDPCSNLASNTRAACEFFGPPDDDGAARSVQWQEVAQMELEGRRVELVNGLTESWTGHDLVFVNPPYDDLGEWVRQMTFQADRGAEIVTVLPARTGARWFHEVLKTANAVILWGPGRIHFGNPSPAAKEKHSPRFDNFVAYWGERHDLFFAAFKGCGRAIRCR